MNSKNILVVGAGGIGSWLCYFLWDLQNCSQLFDSSFTIADGDTVEKKNLKYQKFEIDDITDNKALCMEAKYGFNSIDKLITTSEDLLPYDCIISCVDNTSFRRMMFNTCIKTGKYFIDLRSEGTTIMALTQHKKNDIETLLATIPEEIQDASCQRPFELEGGIIQQGNKIIAGVGSQFVLNYIREDKNPAFFSQNF
jgi:tRNA A37 threonylcarbamoyladenosine dehydratase